MVKIIVTSNYNPCCRFLQAISREFFKSINRLHAREAGAKIRSEENMVYLQGRVKFPTGGDSPRPLSSDEVDLVKIRDRQ
ncbi:hypothetical protein LPAF129_09580 [Ligilactobacillus pabuli]|uniref:Uncharacterized protein n=1 Tax=Ligilactobacillus pabuli TaxID=2886039 RepID=A0ABQ5JJ23_9LACO|nr:hypothetical protein LPAF129_09580 [Ligilactobacillus pabuli]